MNTIVKLFCWSFIHVEVHLTNAIFFAENAIRIYFEFLRELKHGHNSATG